MIAVPFLLVLALALQPGQSRLETIARNTMSGVDTPRQAVARTQSEWAALWRTHAGDMPAPKVDFAKAAVVAVFLGTRTTAGYAVVITGTRMDGPALVVQWSERRPGSDQITAQVITTPAHLVTIPAFAGEIRFEKVDR